MSEDLPKGTELLRSVRSVNDASNLLVRSLVELSNTLDSLSARPPLPCVVYLAIIDTRLALLATLHDFDITLNICLELIGVIGMLREDPTKDVEELWGSVRSCVNEVKETVYPLDKTIATFRDSWAKLRANLLTPPPWSPPQTTSLSFVHGLFSWTKKTDHGVPRETQMLLEAIDDLASTVDTALGAFAVTFHDFARFWGNWNISEISLSVSQGTVESSAALREVVGTWDLDESIEACSSEVRRIQATLMYASPRLNYTAA